MNEAGQEKSNNKCKNKFTHPKALVFIMDCSVPYTHKVCCVYRFTKWSDSFHFPLRVFFPKRRKKKKSRPAQNEFWSWMKIKRFFAMDICTIDRDLQSFIDADTIYPCINYTLASTLFQIKRIIFMHACENTKLLTKALPVSILWISFYA